MVEVVRVSNDDLNILAVQKECRVNAVTDIEVETDQNKRPAILLSITVPGAYEVFHLALSPPAARYLSRELKKAVKEYLNSDVE